jgi:hypothetical protein
MPPVGFDPVTPAIVRLQAYALDRTAAGTGRWYVTYLNMIHKKSAVLNVVLSSFTGQSKWNWTASNGACRCIPTAMVTVPHDCQISVFGMWETKTSFCVDVAVGLKVKWRHSRKSKWRVKYKRAHAWWRTVNTSWSTTDSVIKEFPPAANFCRQRC